MSDKVGNPDLLHGGQKPDKKRTRRSQHQKYIDQLALAETRNRSLAAPRPTQAKALPSKPRIELDPSPGTRSVAEIADRIERVAKQDDEANRAVAAVRRQSRKAERVSGDGDEISGTGYTILKMRPTPMQRLIDAGKIGMEEIQAADEIASAFLIISSASGMRAPSFDRVDSSGGGAGAAPMRLLKQVRRFQRWAQHWTRLRDLSDDPMLEIMIAVAVDERQIREVACDIGRRHSLVEQGFISGLRDYAARAGFVAGAKAEAWMQTAEHIFTPAHQRLIGAIRRARVEL